MTKQSIRLVLTSVLGFAAVTVPACAQELEQAKISIPFAFRAGSVTLPAGEYNVVRENDFGVVLLEGRGGSVMLMTHPGGSATSQSALKFERTGGASPVLKEVQIAGAPVGLLPSIQ